MAGKTQIVKGRIKEAAGALTGNKALKREGKRDQAVGKVKEAVGKVRKVISKAFTRAQNSADNAKGATGTFRKSK